MKKSIFRFAALSLIAASACVSCLEDMVGKEDMEGMIGSEGSIDGSEVPEGGSEGNTNAGKLTAGEWRDLDNWNFWSGLMLNQDSAQSYSEYNSYWQFYTGNRVAVKAVSSTGKPVVGAYIVLKKGNEVIWETRTDNRGRAECWVNLFTGQQIPEEELSISIDGVDMSGRIRVMDWKTDRFLDGQSDDQILFNEYLVNQRPESNDVDIAFIVDATGSMSDEISFLKSDLVDIIGKVGNGSSRNIRTAALMYRDEGDDYVTRVSNFADVKSTSNFISEQNAAGGGDYPEAVHTALEKALQSLSWNDDAHTRLAFMLLDAPAHHNDEVIASLHKQIASFAKAGIRIIPVAASGVDKATEFMLRYFAIATDGTYTFLTNHSGIGGDHIVPTIGDYKVEQLNELIVRLITEFIE